MKTVFYGIRIWAYIQEYSRIGQFSGRNKSNPYGMVISIYEYFFEQLKKAIFILNAKFSELGDRVIMNKSLELFFSYRRSPGDLRPISCEVNLHPPLHGSALFQRGQTQVRGFSTNQQAPQALANQSAARVMLSKPMSRPVLLRNQSTGSARFRELFNMLGQVKGTI